MLYIAPMPLLLATLLHPGVAEGEDYTNKEEKVQIQAEELSYEEESGLYTASEGVVIRSLISSGSLGWLQD